MATLKKNWLLSLFGAKPHARRTSGIEAFNAAVFKESNGATPKLREIYRRYKDSEKKAA